MTMIEWDITWKEPTEPHSWATKIGQQHAKYSTGDYAQNKEK
jgi:hypothetical protein